MLRNLSTFTENIERQRDARAFATYLRECVVLGRAAATLPAGPEYAPLRRALSGDALATVGPRIAFVQQLQTATIFGGLVRSGATSVAPYTQTVFIDARVVAGVVPEGHALPYVPLPMTLHTPAADRIGFVLAIDARILQTVDARTKAAFDAALATAFQKLEDDYFFALVNGLTGVPTFTGDLPDALATATAALGLGAVPIAVVSTATANWLAGQVIGQHVRDDSTGTLAAMPCLVSPWSVDPDIVVVDARATLIVDDGLAVANGGSVTLDTAQPPTNASVPVTPSPTISVFQTNAIALRAERFLALTFVTATPIAKVVTGRAGS